MDLPASLLENIKIFFQHKVYPIAAALDTDSKLMKKIFDEFKQAGYFKIYFPSDYSGKKLSENERIELQESVGQWGGAFGFLQVQSNIVNWLLEQSSNNCIKEYYYKQLSKNETTVGNVTSQMKPTSKLVVNAIETDGGYRLSGRIPFATGWQFFDELLIGFRVGADKEVFTIIPFKAGTSHDGSIEIGSVLETLCMQSINTVSISLKNYLVPYEKIILEWPTGTFFEKYCSFPPSAFTLGIAMTALKLIEKNMPFIHANSLLESYMSLKEKLSECRQQIRSQPVHTCNEKLSLDVMSISWCCVQAAILVSGGTGLLIGHEAQRLYREILMWIIPKTTPATINNWLINSR
jgi:alkylation response protein AidB-like acyl-CoA dehydrogenase